MSQSADQSARQRMLHDQLQKRGITAPRVLAALASVPRHRFVPQLSVEEAYADRAWNIDCGQTISQPYIVALMTQALELTGSERVLEVGTGSGYQAAVLSQLARQVVTIERHAELSHQAGKVLDALGYTNIERVVGDGSQGWPAGAPYDRIIVTAAAAEPPPALLDQLAEGGILVMPLGDPESQMLQALRKEGGTIHTTNLAACRFVPLISGAGPGD